MAGAISTDAGQWQDVNLYRQQFPFSVCYKFTDEKVICYFATHLTSNAFYLHQIPAACQPSRQSRAFIVLTPVGAVLWCCVQRLPLVYRSLQITLTRGGGWSVSSALKPAPADCGRLVGTRTVPSPHSNHSNAACGGIWGVHDSLHLNPTSCRLLTSLLSFGPWPGKSYTTLFNRSDNPTE